MNGPSLFDSILWMGSKANTYPTPPPAQRLPRGTSSRSLIPLAFLWVYQLPTTHNFCTHDPRLLVTPTLFSRRKSLLYLFFLWILTSSSIILSLFDTQIIYCLTRHKKCLYSKRELNGRFPESVRLCLP